MDAKTIKEIICSIMYIEVGELNFNNHRPTSTVIYARMLFGHHFLMKCGNKHLVAKELNMCRTALLNYYLEKYDYAIELPDKVFINLDKQIKELIDAS